MAKVLIMYYSRSGHTAKMADIIAEGVRASGAEAVVKAVKNTKVDELLKVDGVIIGSPTYYGSMAAEIKKFIDDSVKHHGKLVGKVGGAFTSSGGVAASAVVSLSGALAVRSTPSSASLASMSAARPRRPRPAGESGRCSVTVMPRRSAS